VQKLADRDHRLFDAFIQPALALPSCRLILGLYFGQVGLGIREAHHGFF